MRRAVLKSIGSDCVMAPSWAAMPRYEGPDVRRDATLAGRAASRPPVLWQVRAASRAPAGSRNLPPQGLVPKRASSRSCVRPARTGRSDGSGAPRRSVEVQVSAGRPRRWSPRRASLGTTRSCPDGGWERQGSCRPITRSRVPEPDGDHRVKSQLKSRQAECSRHPGVRPGGGGTGRAHNRQA